MLLLIFVFTLSLFLTLLTKMLAVRLRIVDRPLEARRIHKKPIPNIGGVAVIIAFFAGATLYTGADRYLTPGAIYCSLLIGAIGITDDIFSLDAYTKLLFEFAICSFAVSEGCFFLLPGVAEPFSRFFSTVFFVFFINAFNMCDGFDGQCSVITQTACLTLAAVSGSAFPLILVSAVCGFSVLNLHPASIFGGDSLSLFCGFVFLCMASQVCKSEQSALLLFAVLISVIYPILDAIRVSIFRILSKKSPFSADSSHYHHLLLYRFASQRRALFHIAILCICNSCASLLIFCQKFLPAVCVCISSLLFSLIALYTSPFSQKNAFKTKYLKKILKSCTLSCIITLAFVKCRMI